ENTPVHRSESAILVQYSNKIKSQSDADKEYVRPKTCANYHITDVRDLTIEIAADFCGE
ncbi:unnamed protein product, partial [Rotaria sp. Silwood1]